MKFMVDQKPLGDALALISRVVEKRTTIPILSNVAITARDDALQLRATDLDMELSLTVQADISSPGGCTLPAATLHDIVRKLGGAQITLDMQDERMALALKAGRSRFALPTLPLTDFPDITAGDMTHRFDLPGKTLATMIERTQFAISTEETRYYLNGIFLHESNGHLVAVATDGHRLARYHVPGPQGCEAMPGIIIPRKAVGEILKLAEQAGDEPVTLACSAYKLCLTRDGTRLVTKLIDGTFPDYQRVIPANNNRHATVETGPLKAALERVSVIASEKGRAVKWSLDQQRLALSVTNPDACTAEDDIEIEWDSGPLEIGFNAKYAIECIDNIAADTLVIQCAEPGSPTIFRPRVNDAHLVVLMPRRV